MDLQTKQATYKEGLQKVTEGGVESRVSRAPTAWEPGTSNIGIVDRAVPSNRPVRPRPLINMALAIFLGLGFGCVFSFLIEYVNDKVKNPDDVQEDLNQELLAEIPEPMERKHTRLGTRLVKLELTPAETGTLVHTRPRLAVSEAYRSLRASISLSAMDRPIRSLLVTSAAKGEGKTTTATNLAIALAKEGRSVVIVDTDLRRPTVHTYFGIEGHRNGLYGCLLGKLRLEDAITSKSEMAQLAEPAVQGERPEEKRRRARRLRRRQVTQWKRNRNVSDAQTDQGRNLPGEPDKGAGEAPSTLPAEKTSSNPARALPEKEQTEDKHYEWLLRDTASEPLWLESWRAESLVLDDLCGLSAVDVADPEMSDRLAIRGPASVARLSLADGSRRVLVVGDETEDGAHRYARIEGESAVYLVPNTDLKRVFRSDSELRESIRSHGELAILPCGARRIRMPTEVITSSAMEKLIAELKKRFDFVILDSPPCQFSDPLLLAKYVDGIVVVVQARKYAKSMIEQGIKQLEKVEGQHGVRVLGVALNRFDPRKSGGYGHYGYRSYYYYRYYYGRYYYYYGTGVRHHGFFSYFYKPSRRCGGLLPKRMKEHRVHRIEVQPPGDIGESLAFQWTPAGWLCSSRYNHSANQSKVETFLEHIRRLHGRKVKKVKKHEDVGLGKGQAVRVALHDSGGKPILTLLLGETRDTSRRRLFFKVEGRRTVYRADRDLLGMLRIQSSDEAAKSPPDGRGLLDLDVIRTSSQEVVAVELEIRGKDGQPDQHVELRRKDTTDLEVDPLRTVQVVKLAGNLTKQSAQASVAGLESVI
jgi:Mrp family chromosome partitioning ATPase